MMEIGRNASTTTTIADIGVIVDVSKGRRHLTALHDVNVIMVAATIVIEETVTVAIIVEGVITDVVRDLEVAIAIGIIETGLVMAVNHQTMRTITL